MQRNNKINIHKSDISPIHSKKGLQITEKTTSNTQNAIPKIGSANTKSAILIANATSAGANIANTIFLSILSCIYKSRALLFIVIMYGFPPLFTSINCLLVFPAKKVSVNTCTFPSVSTYSMTTLSIVKSE